MRAIQCRLLGGISVSVLVGCTAPAPTDSSDSTPPPPSISALPTPDGRVRTPEQLEPLARQLAVLLRAPHIQQHLYQAINASPFKERKLYFQKYLGELRGALHDASSLALLDSLVGESEGLRPLELYLPLPEQRAAWHASGRLQVATLVDDDDDPIVFEVDGPRKVITSTTRPTLNTLVLTPAEQRFTEASFPSVICDPEENPGCDEGGGGGGGGGGGASADSNLYMTRLKIDDDYEGILKGAPEFEVHILGPNGTGDSLTTHQCAGGDAGTPYYFDYNDAGQTWTGNVLLFSKTQLAAYRSAYPGKAFRVFVMEDDDDPCVPKLDATQFAQLTSTIATNYPGVDGAIDSTFNLVRTVKGANAFINIISSVISFIQSKDDMVGTALEDAVVGEYDSGMNWIIRGPGNATKGSMKLEMKP